MPELPPHPQDHSAVRSGSAGSLPVTSRVTAPVASPPFTAPVASPIASPITSPVTPEGPPVRVVLAGAHGHGHSHLRNLRRLAESGAVTLVGVCDPVPVGHQALEGLGSPPQGGDLAELLHRTRPDVTVICTPIHTHADLAETAMEADSHVLLEKPPAPSRAEYERILRAADRTGRACQIGFQDLASTALPVIEQLLDRGAIGEVRGIGGACAWVRPRSYFTRSPWAGRRTMDGRPIIDGALTNPFAHAVASALWLARATETADLTAVEVELYHANAIEADDTSCVRVQTRHGTPVCVAATLSAAANHDPHLVVHGSRGRITLFYKRGEVTLDADGTRSTVTYPRTDLLENLIAHIRRPDTVDLLVPAYALGGFMTVVDAVRTAPDPAEITEPARRPVDDALGDRVVVSGVDELVQASLEGLALYSELGAPWSRPPYVQKVEPSVPAPLPTPASTGSLDM